MSKIPPKDDVSTKGGPKKVVKQSFVYKHVHALENVHANGGILHDCKHNRKKLACVHESRESNQGGIVLTGKQNCTFLVSSDHEITLFLGNVLNEMDATELQNDLAQQQVQKLFKN